MIAKPKSAGPAVIAGLLIAGLAAAGGCGRAAPDAGAPATVSDHMGKARAFYQQENYPRAVEMYHKALEMDPDCSDAYLQLGIIYDDNLKDKLLADSYYREYLRRAPNSEKADRVRSWLEETTPSAGRRAAPRPPAEKTPLPARPTPRPPSPPPSPVPPRTPLLPSTPEPGRTPAAVSASDDYTVRSGDTLAGIARKLYGDPGAWNRIFEANRDRLESPHSLKVGQVLAIPR